MGTIRYETRPAWLARAFLLLPRVPGISQALASLFRLIAPLGAAASMQVNTQRYLLDLSYPTHMALMLRQSFEPHEVGVISSLLRPGDTVFDIGANWGLYSLLAASRVGPEGHVIAVEANPKTFMRLLRMQKQAGLPNVFALNYAVSESSGVPCAICREFYRLDTGAYIRLTRTSAEVLTITLDDLHRAFGRPRVRLLKLDVEGAEPLALKGGRQMLHDVAFALVEVSNYCSRFGLNRQQTYSLMREFGFKWMYFGDGDPATEEDPWPSSNVLFSRALIDDAPLPCRELLGNEAARSVQCQSEHRGWPARTKPLPRKAGNNQI